MTDQAKRAEPVIMTEIVFPQDTNPMGTMFGGAAYALMDKAAFVAASRFSGSIVVTASSESVDFRTPIRHGMIIEVIATVIHAGSTSMVVRTELFCQNPVETARIRATVGYFTMVAVDGEGTPKRIPALLIEDDVARAEWELGEEIRRASRQRRARQ